MKAAYYLILLLTVFQLTSCSKEKKVAREIKGKYEVTSFESHWNNYYGCNGPLDITSFSIPNPGKLVFTGKKAIDGPATSPSERPFWGYFDYEYSTTDHLGNPMVATERKYFQYDVLDGHSGDGSVVFTFIYIDGIQYDLEVVKDGKKITAFKYKYWQGCYRAEEIHYVK